MSLLSFRTFSVYSLNPQRNTLATVDNDNFDNGGKQHQARKLSYIIASLYLRLQLTSIKHLNGNADWMGCAPLSQLP
jgi:hypothetical protein